MSQWIVDCQGLTKVFGDFPALIDCDLRVPAGSIIGLLGPNGSGKTTLLRTLLGFQRPTRGRALVCGFDCVEQSLDVRKQVAYLPGDARLFRSMTGQGVLEIFAGLSPHGSLQRSVDVAGRLDLNLKRRVMFMSTGMRQKLALSIVLGSVAPLVILDEPTANLDPNVRGEVVAMVREIRQAGRTVLMSSHIFSDIEDTCDEVVILRSGRLVHWQRLADLDRLHIVQGRCTDVQVGRACIDQPAASAGKLSNAVAWPGFVVHHSSSDGQIELHLSGQAETWLKWLAEQPLADVRIEKATVSAMYERLKPTATLREN